MTTGIALFSHTSIAGGLLYRLITSTTYDEVVKEIVSSTNEVFSTMIPMEITSVSSFYQKEDMISFLPRLYLSSHFNHFKLFTQLKEFTKKKILQSNTINPNT